MLTFLCVGKIKEKYIADGIKDYQKRLSRMTKTSFIVVGDEDGNADPRTAVEKEGAKILAKIPKNSYLIGLDIYGKQLSSEKLAKKIDDLFISGQSQLCFIIGGSYGLSQEIKNKCDFLLSFSKMTFPHQLFRLILFEQIYRCFKINRNETYHK